MLHLLNSREEVNKKVEKVKEKEKAEEVAAEEKEKEAKVRMTERFQPPLKSSKLAMPTKMPLSPSMKLSLAPLPMLPSMLRDSSDTTGKKLETQNPSLRKNSLNSLEKEEEVAVVAKVKEKEKEREVAEDPKKSECLLFPGKHIVCVTNY